MFYSKYDTQTPTNAICAIDYLYIIITIMLRP